MLNNLLRLEWGKLRWPVLITLLSLSLAVALLSGTIYKSYALEHDLEAWEVGISIIVFLFPLIAVLPVGWLMYLERRDGFLMYTLPRVSKRRYLSAKWLVVAGSSFSIMFIAMMIGVIFALYIKPEITPFYSLVDKSTGEPGPRLEKTHFLGSLFVNHPLSYGLLISFWQGVLSAMMATLAFVLSLFVSNVFIILTGPFLYVTLENFILSLLQLEIYRIYTAFNPESFDVNQHGYGPLLVGPALALLFTAGIAFYFSRIQKATVYPS
ncbi:ABC transporter permease [Paenibacillus sp. F411]|uniref:ABC transporter permease n=1 Tax=Paenibacillus sp. F411 TaxID=2820239 RepID=UPI001AAE3EC1|nr:ABC transporter permease [Paenibacillus sp. F411]MBO2943741.1 ABC transporter permease [Paenibacillus sp. F411]